MAGPYLQFDGISKRFPGVQALADVSFGVTAGSVHALLGENGAGKSTLLKILSGVYRPDEGRILLNGQPRVFSSTAEAIRGGIAVIHQELQLVPQVSVAENLYLGHLPNRLGWVDRRRLQAQSIAMLRRLGEEIDPTVRLGELSIGQRQMVEIAKALARDAQVLAFDEPTSSLSARETERLFAVIRQLQAAGKVILYVSHRMGEIYEVCDAATVLRDGRHVRTFSHLQGVDRDTLVQHMVGREITDVFQYRPRQAGEPVLEVEGLCGPGLSRPASFTVRRGEIVGFFGLVGAGRTELMKLTFGAVTPTEGTVRIGGRRLVPSPANSIRDGLVYCPEDRKKEGVVPVRSVMENINLSARRHFSTLGFFIRDGREQENAQAYVDRLAIKTPSLWQLIRNLSGGNQQKVILARSLSEHPKVILLDEPTRGIDVGAKSEIYSIIYDLAERGFGIVVVSSELPEVMGICDRICVMREGKLVGQLRREEATQEELLRMALPVSDAIEQRTAI